MIPRPTAVNRDIHQDLGGGEPRYTQMLPHIITTVNFSKGRGSSTSTIPRLSSKVGVASTQPVGVVFGKFMTVVVQRILARCPVEV